MPRTAIKNTARLFDEYKRHYDYAKERMESARADLEYLVASAAELEGTVTTKFEGGEIKAGYGLRRTLDEARWEEIKAQVPEHLSPVVYKPSLELKGLRYLEEREPDLYKIIATAITEKPSKVSIKVAFDEVPDVV